MANSLSAGANAASVDAIDPAAAGTATPPDRKVSAWLARRLCPVLAAIALVVIAMAVTTWIGPALVGMSGWALPHDLWGTLVAAERLARLQVGGLYTQPTGLVSLPGTAVILVPVAAVIDLAGISLHVSSWNTARPTSWLLAGPYEMALSAVALFAADALAERMRVSRPKRAVLAIASVIALASVSVRWGHPEDAVAVGLLLYAVVAVTRSKVGRAGWLMGAAVAVQPLVLLALPVMVMAMRPGRRLGFLAKSGLPAGLMLAAAAAANWSATMHAVIGQPNWPSVDHRTLWVSLAPHLDGGAVAAGPARVLAILSACGCGVVAGRRLRLAQASGEWSEPAIHELLWWVAVTLALRCVFEPVMVAYYLWPALAVALIAATGHWPRLLATSIAVAVITGLSQIPWQGPWSWWVPMIAGLAFILCLARVPASAAPASAAAAVVPS